MIRELIVTITLMVILAKLFESMFKKWDLNPIPGYIAAGLITKLITESYYVRSQLSSLAYVSLLFFMLYVGLKLEPKAGSEISYSISTSIAGVLAVYIFSLPILLFKNMDLITSFFIATVLANTSTEVVAVALDKKRVLDSHYWLVNASFIDDILVITTLSVATGLAASSNNQVSIALTSLGKAVIFLASSMTTVKLIVKHKPLIYNYMSRNYRIFVTVTIIVMLCTSSLAKLAGLPEILGAYVAGLLVAYGKTIHDPILKSRTALSRFVDEISILLASFFTPLYFSITSYSYEIAYPQPDLLLALMLPALLAKTIAIYPLVYVKTGEKTNSIALSFLMNSRGMLEIAALNILFDTGILNKQIYSTLLVCSLTTTILCPLVFSKIFKK